MRQPCAHASCHAPPAAGLEGCAKGGGSATQQAALLRGQWDELARLLSRLLFGGGGDRKQCVPQSLLFAGSALLRTACGGACVSRQASGHKGRMPPPPPTPS